MKTEQLNLRLEAEIIAALEQAAREESLDRGTMIRKLLRQALDSRHRQRILESLDRGEISIGRAAEETGLTHYDLLERSRAEGRAYPLSPEDVERWLPPVDPPHPRVADRPRKPGRRELPPRETLADRPPRPGGVLLVGINPAPPSVAAGHYYQGRLGKRMWKRLERVGLLSRPTPGAEDDAFVDAGHGLTDLSKKVTVSGVELSAEELAEGARELRTKIRSWRPGLVLFAFAQAARAVLGAATRPGPGPELDGVPTFLLTGPYARGAESLASDRQLERIVQPKRSAPRRKNSV